MREVIEVLLFVAIIFIIVRFTIQTYSLGDGLMGKDFQPGQVVLVNKVAYLIGEPQRGDVVAFADPRDPSQVRVRRVLAVPGDKVTVNATQIIVNGTVLKESYIEVPFGSAPNDHVLPEQTLGKSEYFVAADVRAGTGDTDSRGKTGLIPRSNIIGKATLIFWPVGKFHFVSTYSDTFSNVKGR